LWNVKGRGRPHARAMGDGLASADLLPEEEVDEDLADDVLDAAVTDAGGRASRGRWQHRRGRPCGWRRRAPAHRSCGGCFWRFVRRSWFYAGQVASPSRWRDGEQSNGARSLSCFEFCFLRIEQRRSIALRGGERARSRRHALGLGWPGGTPHGLGYPPSAYKTGGKNLYDLKTRGVYT